MEKVLLGKKIRDLRKYLHITQKELADGICTQSMISLLENNEEIYPSAQLLYMLSKRLGVSIEYFFSDKDVYGLNYVNEICDQLTTLIQSKRYQLAYRTIQKEKHNPDFSKPHLQKFILWREAICINHLFQDRQKALEKLKDAMTLTDALNKNYSTQDLEILTSKAIIYGEDGQWDKADQSFDEIIRQIERASQLMNAIPLINTYYNASRTSLKLQKSKKALELSEKGIALCLKQKTFYNLGYLYYQKAECLKQMNVDNQDDIITFYNKALQVFQMIDDTTNIKKVTSVIRDRGTGPSSHEPIIQKSLSK
ncbi:helix-turn-helix domain-containing protein [Halalkalibacter okhensis]|uniref:HTH cro/C1-type domain-containing protein n=1 Tax=Halalkalibacter okhensis TaxID=333138 RepID=A0A0B0IFL3_9BACI|nr:helix-turn-helix domain-containing protein [Halalkalibacter okhensis]KHF38446.1 hypothetical protein LQ50_21155 [Halalkalibacter okhensis]